MVKKGKKRVAICGFGKMGEALAMGLTQSGLFHKKDFVCTVRHPNSKARVTDLGFSVAKNNTEAAQSADIILLTVKPTAVNRILQEIRPVVGEQKLLISIAAGASLRDIETALDTPVPVIRAMPNTPTLIRQGITVFAGGTNTRAEHLQQAKAIFDALGTSLEMDEVLMDAATGLSGSGPAFVFLVIEALMEGGVKVGFPREISRTLVAHTVRGAAALMIDSNKHPALLKDDVATPAGCTIDGLLELEKGGVRNSLIHAVVMATQRAKSRAKPGENSGFPS